jgi:predicted naringenin-chalcone synthase
MTLSRKVPLLIRNCINQFVTDLCAKAGINFEQEKENMFFAIHPGGPRIIEYIIDELGLDYNQAKWSHEVLRNNGNMSSATVPYILNEMLQSSEIAAGKKIVTMAFGPGLTATGLVLEKL